jgi:2,3-bisphosphoglycerate-independent phosphoglycerate mutase
MNRLAAALEAIDRRLGELLATWEGRPLQVAVASDHATLSESGQHSSDPVPVVIWGPGIEPDAVTELTERAVIQGALGRFPLQTLMARLFEL